MSMAKSKDWREEEQSWRTHTSQFQALTTELQDLKDCGHEDRNTEQCNRIKSPEINPNIDGQPIFDVGAKIF